ncbi:tyrosine-protein kinase domain-containing protein [Adhaeretor mobilis]|uniref:Tyrosine-protein kinase YwqD n=1 Tax=Adhaeretor mobilis TaxID=1930276 RepID=A0A517N2P7_9BACT|nr:tyrosine-protein kinase family protein [Adhaeretor mobilis]QDT01419.1 Tyrosine-protein kinase YwqD [Adhaeretor mobilis]
MANHDDNFSSPAATYEAPEREAPSRALVTAPPAGPASSPIGAPAPMYAGEDLLRGGLSQKWLMNCLRRRWLMASLLGLLAAALVAIPLYLLFPESHKTVAYYRINSSTQDNPIGKSTRSNMDTKSFAIFAKTQAALVKTPLVLNRALAEPKVRQTEAYKDKGDNASNWLNDELRVNLASESEILELRYDGPEDKNEMELIMNAVCDAFEEQILLVEREKRSDELEQLVKLHKKVKEDVAEKFKKFKQLAEASGAGDSETAANEVRMLTSEIMEIQRAISKIEKEMIEVQIRKEIALREIDSPARLDAMVDGVLASDITIKNYEQELFGLEQQLRGQGGVGLNQQAPNLIRLRNMIAQSSQNLNQYRSEKEKQVRKDLADRPDNEKQRVIIEFRMRMQAAAAQYQKLSAQLEEKNDLLALKSKRDPDLAILQQEVERERETESILASKVQSQRLMQDDSRRKQIEVIQKATATTNITTIERLAIAGVGGLSALALTCYGVALMDFRKRRLNGPTDLDEGLGIRVLGVLPAVTARKALAGGNMASVQVSEAIDNVRATLMHDSTSKKRQVVLVTSSDTLDGCTTVASTLAVSLARAGRRTLLIDGDLRSPSLHNLFGLPLDDGFSEVLRTEAELTDVIRPTSTESLYVITAGICDSSAVHALATDQPQPIFEKLREQFDFIIVDSAPVLSVSDSLSLGQYVDGAVLSVLRDHSELRKVNKAAELLDGLGIRLLGTVVNGMPLKTDRRILQLHKNTVRSQKQLAAPDKKAKKSKGKSKKAAKAEAKAKAEKPAEPTPTAIAVAEPPKAAPPKPIDPVVEEKGNSIDLDDIQLDMDDFDIDEL